MLNLASNITCLTTVNKESCLWHKRLCHVSFDPLSRVWSKDVVNGIPKLKFEKDRICDTSQFEKDIMTVGPKAHHSSFDDN